MPMIIDQIDALSAQADDINWEINQITAKLKKDIPLEPPEGYEDCIDELEAAGKAIAVAVTKLNIAWRDAKKGGA
jgi:hypothetical protein